jgi:HAD superfamily hydrolase (TIGR01662 family)
MIRGVIFDYGSTLIYFDGDMAEVRIRAHQSLVQSLLAAGLEIREGPFVERFTRKFDEYDRRRGNDHLETTATSVLIDTLREEGVPPQPPERIRKSLREMYEIYEQHWALFPETLDALRQVQALRLRMALLSNASDEDNVRQMLKNHRLDRKFKPVVISAAVGVRKPDARAFQPILEAWKLPPQEIVMVGDQLGMDILGAQSLGLRTIWLRTEEKSATNKPFLGKIAPDAQVRTIGEVAAILSHWRGK